MTGSDGGDGGVKVDGECNGLGLERRQYKKERRKRKKRKRV